MKDEIGFLFLMHFITEQTIQFINSLAVEKKNFLVIHIDAKAGENSYNSLIELEKQHAENLHVIRDRILCHWGEISLVSATLHGLQRFRSQYPSVEHIQLMSGQDVMVCSRRALLDRLESNPNSTFIDCHRPADNTWVKQGSNEERYEHHHFIKWHRSPKLHMYQSRLQRFLGVKRTLPLGLEPIFGSQWINFHAAHVDLILDFVRQERAILQFFSNTMVPDEMFFQSILFQFMKDGLVRLAKTLTHCEFYPNGTAVTYFDSHACALLKSGKNFARKAAIGSKILPKLHLMADDIDKFSNTINGIYQYNNITPNSKFSQDWLSEPGKS